MISHEWEVSHECYRFLFGEYRYKRKKFRLSSLVGYGYVSLNVTQQSLCETFFIFLQRHFLASQPKFRVCTKKNFFHYLYHVKLGFLANIYVVNRWKSENDRPIVWWAINLSFSKNLIGEGGNSSCSVPCLGTPVSYLKKLMLWRFSNPSWFDISPFWFLVTLCSMPRGL